MSSQEIIDPGGRWNITGRRAGQRFDAELGVTTEALVFLGELDPEYVGSGILEATHYEPTPPRDFEAIMDAIKDASKIDFEDFTFVDVGSGMGRVIMLAARRPFARILGIEISPALHRISQENLGRARDPLRKARDIRVVRADATDYSFPRGNIVLYLYNPFRAMGLARMLERIVSRNYDRELILAYHTPVQSEIIEVYERFDLLRDLGFARIYRMRRPSEVAAPPESNPGGTG